MMNDRRLIPRFRLTIRSTMLLVAIVALIVSVAVGVDPLRRDPYTVRFRWMSNWCSSSVDAFQDAGHYDLSGPKPVWVIDRHAAPSVACLLKLALVERPTQTGPHAHCNVYDLSLAIDGRYLRRFEGPGSTGTWQSNISPGEMVSLQKLVARLPSSQRWIRKGKVLLVAFIRNGVWVTRFYDMDKLPPEVSDLTAKTWPTIPWEPIPQGTAPTGGKGAPGSPSGL